MAPTAPDCVDKNRAFPVWLTANEITFTLEERDDNVVVSSITPELMFNALTMLLLGRDTNTRPFTHDTATAQLMPKLFVQTTVPLPGASALRPAPFELEEPAVVPANNTSLSKLYVANHFALATPLTKRLHSK